MTKSTPTLTQSGLLAVLLQRQRYKVIQLAWRRAQRKHVRAAIWSTLTWPWHALMAPTLVDVPRDTWIFAHVSPNPHVHRTPGTDSQRSPNPTSRMDPAKWRIPHVRCLRVTPRGNARHFDANRIQRVYRSSSSRSRTGSNWKVKGGVRESGSSAQA